MGCIYRSNNLTITWDWYQRSLICFISFCFSLKIMWTKMLSNMDFLPSSPLPLSFCSVFTLIIFIWRLCEPEACKHALSSLFPRYPSILRLLCYFFIFFQDSITMHEFYYLGVHFSCLIPGGDSFPAIYCTIDIKHIFLFKNWYSIKSEKIPWWT